MATPSAFEQLTLELINQARLEPHGEYDRWVTNAPANVQGALTFFAVDLNLLRTQFDALVPVAPLAWNPLLGESAQAHTQLMLDHNQQSHNLPGEPGLGARIALTGYNRSSAGENIYAFADDAVHAHAGFFIDWGGGPSTGGIQSPPGHRDSIMNGNFVEIGVGHIAGTGAGPSPVGPNLVTHHLADRPDYTSQVVGVIFDDADGDRFYDMGEGTAGTVSSGGVTASAYDTGGFNLDLAPGTHVLSFTALGRTASITVALGDANIKVDLVDPGSFRSSVAATLGAGGVALDLLGEAGIAGTGNGAGNLLAGNRGNNTLDGSAGTDAVFFTGARSDYTVAAGAGGAIITDNRAGSPDGTDTVLNIERLSFAGTEYVLSELLADPGAAPITPGSAGTFGDDTLTGTPGGDAIDGLAGNDTIGGLAGIDSLYGSEGNDLLDGGADADYLLGSAGNDTYRVDDTFDLVDEGAVFPAFAGLAGDRDTIVSTADWFWDVYSVAETIAVSEAVANPGPAGQTIVGSVFSGEIVGNSGLNILFGRGGSDIYRPGAGVDYVSFSTLGATDENAYEGVDGVNTLVMKRGNGYDIVFEFEPGKDKVDLTDFGLSSVADLFAFGFDDTAGNSYFYVDGGSDYLYFIGLKLADLQPGDFII